MPSNLENSVYEWGTFLLIDFGLKIGHVEWISYRLIFYFAHVLFDVTSVFGNVVNCWGVGLVDWWEVGFEFFASFGEFLLRLHQLRRYSGFGWSSARWILWSSTVLSGAASISRRCSRSRLSLLHFKHRRILLVRNTHSSLGYLGSWFITLVLADWTLWVLPRTFRL